MTTSKVTPKAKKTKSKRASKEVTPKGAHEVELLSAVERAKSLFSDQPPDPSCDSDDSECISKPSNSSNSFSESCITTLMMTTLMITVFLLPLNSQVPQKSPLLRLHLPLSSPLLRKDMKSASNSSSSTKKPKRPKYGEYDGDTSEEALKAKIKSLQKELSSKSCKFELCL